MIDWKNLFDIAEVALVIITALTSAYAVNRNQTVRDLRSDVKDWKERVDLRETELKDERAKTADLSQQLAGRPDLNHVLSVLKDERDQATKRHEELMASFQTQMDRSNVRQEKYNAGLMEVLGSLKEGMETTNQAMSALASQIATMQRPTTSRTRRTDK